MSAEVIQSLLFKILIACIVGTLGTCYENVYDLLERKHQKSYYDPQFRRFQTSETFLNYDNRDPYYFGNRRLYWNQGSFRPHFNKFGNGYDNLGNGLPTGRFVHEVHGDFRGGWEVERRPFHRRNYDDRFHTNYRRFEDYPYHVVRKYYFPRQDESASTHHGLYRNHYGSSGNVNVAQADRFLEDNENKNHKKTDEVYQKSQESLSADSAKREKAGEKSHTDQAGENKFSLRSNRVVKKGHVTKGFSSHHHKDETGNSTTFFDEFSDFGGQSDFKDKADGYGTRRTLEQITNTGDEKFFQENEGQIGNYGTGFLKGNKKEEKEFSSVGNHSEDKEKFFKDGEHENGKTYQYLNGDKFEISDPRHDSFYI